MSTTTARAFRLAARLDTLLSDNAAEQARSLSRIAEGDLSPEADAAADRAFNRGETLVARRLVVDRYLAALPLAA